MDCSDSADPSKVEVHHQVSGDLSGDGIQDTVVAASCVPLTNSCPDEVRIFNGDSHSQGGDPLMHSDEYPGARVTSLRLHGHRLTITGTRLADNDPLCCPSLNFTDVVGFGGEEWTRLSHHEADPTPAPKTEMPGYGRVKLGMTRDELLATGQVTAVSDAYASTTYRMAQGGDVCYSEAKNAAMVIGFSKGMATSAGIEIGSAASAFHAVYPDATQDGHGYWIVPVRDKVHYSIGVTGGRVTEIAMARADQDCYG